MAAWQGQQQQEQRAAAVAAGLAAQRAALQQLNDAIVQNNEDKEVTGQRLDAVFDLVDTRMGEYTETTRNIASRIDTADVKAESLTEVINELGKNVSERIQLIEAEMLKMQPTFL